MIGQATTGVWFSDAPLDADEGARGDVLLRVTLPVGKRVLDRHEWIEKGKPYREWQLPAALVNARATCVMIIHPWRREHSAAW